MKKRFNVTGTCIPEKHYMVDISNKLDSILKLVNDEEYFIINRPRQFYYLKLNNNIRCIIKNGSCSLCYSYYFSLFRRIFT
ncbi:hypothetical protein NPD5_4128 [Clostridium sporogenes]|uniref:Uncharacterized protein n=1 Tax=Clostridium sporogenes TaxID=1509 RepID=A0A1L3NI61_CLOSG|nr:hypothetical protein [Clostridium sporogenes]APH15817.1 hypothetical protein NPD5_4128 [Clostridium sporogenes]